jgi:DNA-binding NarL/FixJ family response regulator
MDALDTSLRVHVAARQELFRRGVISTLRDNWPLWCYRQSASVEALRAALDEATPTLLLLDLDLPGPTAAQELRQLRSLHPECLVVALAESEDRAAILQCLEAGALAYVSKAASPVLLLRAVETVLAGGVFAPASLAGSGASVVSDPDQGMRPVPALASFTDRQSEVFRLLAEGCATKTIARRLDLAVGTVKVHLAAIYRQLGVHGRLEALASLRHAESGAFALAEVR